MTKPTRSNSKFNCSPSEKRAIKFNSGLRGKEALMQGKVDQSHLKFTPTQIGDTCLMQGDGGRMTFKFTPT